MAQRKEIDWVTLCAADIDDVDRIARQIHLTLPERKEIFAEKLRLFPRGCFKLLFNGRMAGYAISHPWKLYSIPPLDEFLRALPETPDCMYLHDIAVLPAARGYNAAGLLLDEISDRARNMRISHLACVSVYGTDVLWARFGFRAVAPEDIAAQLGSYGESAKYMVADVAA